MDKIIEDTILENQNSSDLAKEYSEDNFWEKVKKFALVAGKEVIEKALTLYYVTQEENVPAWAKTTIYGALAYFISPIDAIPDITPLIGYSDDLGALAIAIATVSAYINDNAKEKAKTKLNDWFGK